MPGANFERSIYAMQFRTQGLLVALSNLRNDLSNPGSEIDKERVFADVRQQVVDAALGVDQFDGGLRRLATELLLMFQSQSIPLLLEDSLGKDIPRAIAALDTLVLMTGILATEGKTFHAEERERIQLAMNKMLKNPDPSITAKAWYIVGILEAEARLRAR